jgi:transposase
MEDEADQALACYGAVAGQQRFFVFADGQPNSDKTIAFLDTLLQQAKVKAKRVLLIVWDRATWHKSHKVMRWIRQHNRQVKQHGGVRLLTFLLPVHSPWLNPMEPIWLQAKRNVAQPDGELTVKVLKERLCAHFQTSLEAATLKVSA